jgi:hypothetical protein
MSYKKHITFLLLVALCQAVWGQSFEENRTYTRTFKVAPSAIVEINNKYGAVIVSTWDKDSVRIEATCHIAEKNEERFKKIKENIDFNFVAAPTHVLAETVFGSKHSTIIQNVKEVTNFLSATDARSRIDYKVYINKNNHLKITNKYGDVVLPSMAGNVTVDLSNGNLQARELSGSSTLNLAFGAAKIKLIQQGQVAVNFVDFTCEQGAKLTLDAKSSQVTIDQCDQLKFSSRRDQVTVGNVGSVTVESYFSKLKLLYVADAADLKLTYGELSTLGLGKSFKKCLILSQMCDVGLVLETPLPYNAMIKGVRAQTVFPAGLKTSTPNAEKAMELNPVKFVFEKTLPESKLNINISDAELKIEHN